MRIAVTGASGNVGTAVTRRLLREDGYVVTNGPAFSRDGRTLYHSDSLQRRILARSVEGDGRARGGADAGRTVAARG